MQLIIVPLTLFAIAQYFTSREKLRTEEQQKIDKLKTEEQHKIDREEAIEDREESILQAYLEKMQDMLLEKDLISSQSSSSIAKFARALTLLTLERLSPARKGTVLIFLDEMNLIQGVKGDPIISLAGADLAGVGSPIGILSINLERADLRGADLRGAKLDCPNFKGANLESCELSDASLVYADLRGTNLETAILDNVNLYEAIFDTTTILPNGKNWSNTDITTFKAKLTPVLTDEEIEEINRELHIS